MILWVLVFLLGTSPGSGYYLTGGECEKVQGHKARPKDWECLPVMVPVDRR